MDPNKLLPYILETLSYMPNLCDTFENIRIEIEEQLKVEQGSKYTDVRDSVQRAIKMGQSLGIITQTNGIIRLPFNYRNGKGTKAPMIPETVQVTESNCSSLEERPRARNGIGQTQSRIKKSNGAGECEHDSEHGFMQFVNWQTSKRILPKRRVNGMRKGGRKTTRPGTRGRRERRNRQAGRQGRKSSGRY